MAPVLPNPVNESLGHAEVQPGGIQSVHVVPDSENSGPRTSAAGSTEDQRVEMPDSNGLRRSKRSWCPSSKALEQIVAGEDLAAAVDDLLTGEDSASCVSQVYDNPFFQSEIVFATQDVDVPRTYAQMLRLPMGERIKWIAACRRECQSHLQIPSISGILKQTEWPRPLL